MSGMTVAQKEAYIAAVSCLARAFRKYRENTGTDAILVGGASVVIMTGGQFFSGDFDFLAVNDGEMAECMAATGFVREDRPGVLRLGWYHPDHPLFGFQQVSGPLFDGRTERARMLRIKLRDGGDIALPPVEDMIADRLAQHAVATPTDTSRLVQARAMLAVSPSIDRGYLIRRVVEEGGDAELLVGYYPNDYSVAQEVETWKP